MATKVRMSTIRALPAPVQRRFENQASDPSGNLGGDQAASRAACTSRKVAGATRSA